MGRKRCYVLILFLLLCVIANASKRIDNEIDLSGDIGVYTIGGSDSGEENITWDFNSVANAIIFGSSSGADSMVWGGFDFNDINSINSGVVQITDGGLLVTGSVNGYTIPSGSGSRLMWIPSIYAFRAGAVQGAQWDEGDIGTGSFAGGLDVTASGNYTAGFGFGGVVDGIYGFAAGRNSDALAYASTCFGEDGEASGNWSTHFGDTGVASGYYSAHFGDGGVASNYHATHFGDHGVASGFSSTHFGLRNLADCYGLVAFGRFSEATGGDPNNWVDSEPIIVVGNGIDSDNRSTVLTIYKDGDIDTDGTIDSGAITSKGTITILNSTPILVFKDSDSLGAASVGFIEWRDSGGGRAGFLGNHTSGNDDLLWKNEQGGNIGIQTTGAGKFQIFANVELTDDLTLFDGVIDITSSINLTNLVRNPNFVDGTIWSLTLFSITTGKARASLISGQIGIVQQTVVGMEAGKVYDLTYTMTISGGGFNPIFKVSVGGNTLTQQTSSVTAFTERFTAQSTADLVFTATSTPFANDFTIDDVIITERNANSIIGELDVSSIFTDAIILEGEKLLPPFWENLGAHYITLVVTKSLDIIGTSPLPHIFRGGMQVTSPISPTGGTVFEVFQESESIEGIKLYNETYSDAIAGLTISELDDGDVNMTVVENLGIYTGGTISIGGKTNNIQITTDGDTFWEGVGTGLVYGHMAIPGTDIVVSIDDTDPNEVLNASSDGWASIYENETTFAVSDLHYITVTIAGTYEVPWNMAGHIDFGAQSAIHGGVMIDGVAVRNNGEDHTDVLNQNDSKAIGATATIDCPNGTEEISLWISNSNSADVHIEHGDMVIKLIGGI